MTKYQGCTNCKFQPAPLQACNWLKVQTVYHTICPKWEPKNTDDPDTNVGEWIPCSERLPDKEGAYLFTCKTISGIKYVRPGVLYSNGKFGSDNVIAWMPLPEPYKESED